VNLNVVMARSIDEPAFSTSDDMVNWQERWCNRCVRDVELRDGTGPGCPLPLVAFQDRTPAEWLRQPDDSPDEYHCVMFRDERDPGPSEPRPIPDPPGQGVLFGRDGWERPCRMFADTRPTSAEVAS